MPQACLGRASLAGERRGDVAPSACIDVRMPQPTLDLPIRHNSAASLPTLAGRWAPWFACVALVGATTLLAARDSVTVRLTVDGRARTLATHAGSVADLLALTGVPVAVGDLVQPGPDTRLAEGSMVVVQHARPVRIRADGRTIATHSHGRSALAALQEGGIALGPGDVVTVNGQEWPVDRPVTLRRRVVQLAGGPGRSVPMPAERPISEDEAEGLLPGADASWLIEVHRAVPITVVENGVAIEIQAGGPTLGQALAAAGLPLAPGDEANPPPSSPLRPGMRVELVRGLPFVVVMDGQEHPVRANAATVGEALPKTGLPIGPLDYTDPPADTPLTPDLRVEVVRVAEEVETREVAVPFARREEANPAADLDSVTVLQAGVPGLARQEVRLSYENGRVVAEEVLAETVLQAPVDEIVAYGTNVIWNTVETEQGTKRYWRHLRAYASSYSLSRAGTPKSAPWYGRTRMGLPMGKGIVAVDPKIIPLGMWLYVPGYGVGIAGDTGGGVRGYHVDLGFDDDNYEGWHWPVDVYILERLPPEHQMRWILPPGPAGLGVR